jgi:hypothetical protein
MNNEKKKSKQLGKSENENKSANTKIFQREAKKYLDIGWSVIPVKRHILLCDNRRGDLIRSYFDVVKCIKDMGVRQRCDIIFWQDIWKKTGSDLRDFLAEKYGIKASYKLLNNCR